MVDFIGFQWDRGDLIDLYLHPGNMHFNWYEHELYDDTVQIAINATKAFVAEMEKIRAEDVPSFPPSRSLTRAQARRLTLLNTPPTDYPPRYADVSLLPPVEPEPPEVRR